MRRQAPASQPPPHPQQAYCRASVAAALSARPAPATLRVAALAGGGARTLLLASGAAPLAAAAAGRVGVRLVDTDGGEWGEAVASVKGL